MIWISAQTEFSITVCYIDNCLLSSMLLFVMVPKSFIPRSSSTGRFTCRLSTLSIILVRTSCYYLQPHYISSTCPTSLFPTSRAILPVSNLINHPPHVQVPPEPFLVLNQDLITGGVYIEKEENNIMNS